MIHLKNITKQYNAVVALKPITQSFKKGEKYCIMGRSGSGKSTLLNIILGLEKPDSGEIILENDFKFSCLFQENRLVEAITAEKNLIIACGKKNFLSAAQEVGLTMEDLKKPVSKLSGGQKRRIAILRAMLCESDAVIFDEAMRGLDAETESMVKGFIMRNLAGRTFIAVTHSLAEAESYNANIITIE